MFGKIKDMMGQFSAMQQMMKDENFRAFISHPKIQELMKDPEFVELLKANDFSKLATNPKLAALQNDPELAQLAAKMNSSKLQGNWPKK